MNTPEKDKREDEAGKKQPERNQNNDNRSNEAGERRPEKSRSRSKPDDEGKLAQVKPQNTGNSNADTGNPKPQNTGNVEPDPGKPKPQNRRRNRRPANKSQKPQPKQEQGNSGSTDEPGTPAPAKKQNQEARRNEAGKVSPELKQNSDKAEKDGQKPLPAKNQSRGRGRRRPAKPTSETDINKTRKNSNPDKSSPEAKPNQDRRNSNTPKPSSEKNQNRNQRNVETKPSTDKRQSNDRRNQRPGKPPSQQMKGRSRRDNEPRQVGLPEKKTANINRNKRAVVFGASGLTGTSLVKQLLDHPFYREVIAVNRKPLKFDNPHYKEFISDLSDLDKLDVWTKTDEVYCCLGTTIKKAGSKVNFTKVDLDLPVKIGEACQKAKIPHLLIVSSIGAKAQTGNFYLRTKGEMERAIIAMDIAQKTMVRPSMLLGDRQESRPSESVGKMVMKILKPLMLGPLKKYRGIQAGTVAQAMIIIANSTPTARVVFESDELQEIVDGES